MIKIKVDDEGNEMTLDEVTALGNTIIKQKVDKIKNKFIGWKNARKTKKEY